MTITFNPVLLGIGPVAIRWFGVLALAGLGLAVWLSLRELDSDGLVRQPMLNALAWALPAGVLGARLVHVLGYWDYYLTNSGQMWQLSLDGLSLWGALAVGGLVAAARLGPSAYRARALDACLPALALGIAIGRVGEFLDGQGQGLPSSLTWATQYSNPLAATPDFGVPRHPAQLYDAFVALLLGGTLWLLPRNLPKGTRVAVFLVVYGAARLLLGAVRLDPAFLFGLQIEQLLALCSIATGLAVGARLLWTRDSRRQPAPATADAATTPTQGSLAA